MSTKAKNLPEFYRQEFDHWCDINSIDALVSPSPDAYQAGFEVFLKMRFPLISTFSTRSINKIKEDKL